ncbi:hypothetical protein [Zavarzinella formosa]|uniref:hypothetical protein n=1 Tax=Zavarzinella formosa TaxID=360055 RepID=UPI0002F08AF7|nr:hypothetical protein [Zavarzinella formosa]
MEEKAGLPAASVSEIQRQRGNYRKAVEKIARGYVSDGFAILDGFGWIREMAGDDKYASAAAEYVSSSKDGKTTLLVCPTHKDGDLLTERVWEEMAAAGLLTGEERTFEVLKPTNWTEAERSDPRNYYEGHVTCHIRNGGA